jgi:hypothetical protein
MERRFQFFSWLTASLRLCAWQFSLREFSFLESMSGVYPGALSRLNPPMAESAEARQI